MKPPLMLVFPEPRPDQNIYSLLALIARINGICHLEITGLLLGEEHPVSIMSCQANIKHFCEVTRGVYGSPREILLRFTVLPMLARLGELSPSTLLEVENGYRRPELSMLAFGISKGRRWRICKDCMASEVRDYGIAYWHRTHQIPTIQYCPDHELVLKTFDLRGLMLHERFILPCELTKNIAIGAQADTENGAIGLSLSKLARDALADFSEHISLSGIHAAFHVRLDQFSFLKSDGKVRLPEYLAGFNKEFGEGGLSDTVTKLARVSNPAQLLFGITDSNVARPFAKMLLVYWLFRTWGAFTTQCRWQAVLGKSIDAEDVGPTGLINDKKRVSAESMLQRHRQVCLDYKTSHERPTRLEFMKRSYRSFRWLRQCDRLWLDEELPVMRQFRRQRDLFG